MSIKTHQQQLASMLDMGESADAAAHEEMTPSQRRDIVDVFRKLIDGLYTHLPQKQASYGFDPSQRLRLLGERAADASLVDRTFHRDMAQIITDLRDAHTRYLVPCENENLIWFLPFLVERYVDNGDEHFIVSKLTPIDEEQRIAFKEKGFEQGIELLHWNGTPISRAIEIYAERETGGRLDARIARALESLTIRPLRYGFAPDEHWVDIHFRTDAGEYEQRLKWRKIQMPAASALPEGAAAQTLAFDPVANSAREIKKMLFASSVWMSEQDPDNNVANVKDPVQKAINAQWSRDKTKPLSGRYAGLLYGKVLTTDAIDGESFGYLRLFSFLVANDQDFIDEVNNIIAALPQNGLVIDLRGNPGGNVWAAEGLLQLFSANPIEPTRFSMLATDMTRAMCAARQNRTTLAPWAESVRTALSTGVSHSKAQPLTDVFRCNNRGQRYPGPVVAIVDANTYSAGDLFAAGFVDNNLGTLICTDQATGGGGANVWDPRNVNDALRHTEFQLQPLHGVSYTISFRRATRIGPEGADIEDAGVSSPFRRPLTRRDLLEGNVDLLGYACRHLQSADRTYLRHTIKLTNAGGHELVVESKGLTRLQLLSDGVIEATMPIEDHHHSKSQSVVTHLALGPDWTQRRTELVGYNRVTRSQHRLIESQIIQ